ncbi:unnamed protein product [Menidia menidia]|uniref:(Atlantic silverside) hypothetical protein n=1 Tax=Menidia menidia TaxID=238744 RepID=A0A8S4B1T9_9TELE|nr:unnamed protein product [Menidia menidia]
MKSPAAADQESLQASWWDRRSPLPLRGRDILRLIDCGLSCGAGTWPLGGRGGGGMQQMNLALVHDRLQVKSVWEQRIQSEEQHAHSEQQRRSRSALHRSGGGGGPGGGSCR